MMLARQYSPDQTTLIFVCILLMTFGGWLLFMITGQSN